MYNAFSEGLDQLRDQHMKPKVLKPFDKIEVTGTEELVDKWFKMEVVGVENIFGVSIDREINNRIFDNHDETKRPNLRTYIPVEDKKLNDKLTSKMQMCVKVTTPVKLSLILEKEGTSLIAPEDEMATEVHFVQLEGIHKHYEANFSILKHMWWSMFRSKH